MNVQPDLGSVRGQFSSSLRTRSVWKVIGSVLTTRATALHESRLPGYDFHFNQGNTSQSLRVLLLTSTSLNADSKEQTISQLTDFSTSMLSSPGRYIIALLLSETPFNSATERYSLDALLTLQILIMETMCISMPILPIPDASTFLTSIKEYMDNLVGIPVQEPSVADSIRLLAHGHSGEANVLSEHDINILSDLFPSLKTLSQAVGTHEGQDILYDYLDETKATDFIDFWAGDKLIE